MILVYDYVLTFAQEVTTVWRRKMTATSLLLVTTRWVMVLQAVVQFVPPVPKVRVFVSSR